jgi:lysophospholipase L1-like esterase
MQFLFVFLLVIFSPSNINASEPTSFVMGALGDSITTAFDSYHILSEKSGNWSSGWGKFEDFESHKIKLEKLLEKPVVAFNMAIPGVTSRMLGFQTKRLLKKAKAPDYVTILIGANDACRWKDNYKKDLEKYKNNVASSVANLTLANPKVKILLVPVPNMNRLWELGKDNKKCLAVWRGLNLCNPLFGRNVTDEGRERFSERIKGINSTLKEISEKYPTNVAYYDFLTEIEFDEEYISEIDCFHPSAYGQKMIADVTFNRDLFTEWLPTQSN